MTRHRTSVLVALSLVASLVPNASVAQGRVTLTGAWALDGVPEPTLEAVQARSEEITVTAHAVTMLRSDRPTEAVLYPVDGAERRMHRLGALRLCRTTWEEDVLVIECRSTDGGPGGGAPPVYTRETRTVDADGRMVVTVTWRSDKHVTTRTSRYRKAVLR